MYRPLLFLAVVVWIALIAACSVPAGHECHGGCACYSYDDCPQGCVKSIDDAGKSCSEI